MFNNPVEIRKQGALDEAQEPEPEHKERTVPVSHLSERLGLIEACIKAFEDTDWNKQREAATGQGVMRMLACYEEILKKKKYLSGQTSVYDFFKSSSGTCTVPPVLLDIGDDDPAYSSR